MVVFMYKEIKLKLKTCPFCKTKPKVGSLGGDEQNWAIWCPKCGIPCVEGGNLKLLEKKWNNRKK